MANEELAHTVVIISSHPNYNDYVKESIKKLASKKLELWMIAGKNNLNFNKIFGEHEKHHYIAHVNAILLHHRSIQGNQFLPEVLPNGSRALAAEMLANKHRPKVDAHFQKLKAKHQKLETKVKSSVKRKL
jgi:uncharacterized protein YdcH (DUF465 family)